MNSVNCYMYALPSIQSPVNQKAVDLCMMGASLQHYVMFS